MLKIYINKTIDDYFIKLVNNILNSYERKINIIQKNNILKNKNLNNEDFLKNEIIKLEDSIKSWEDYKEQWSDVLSDYQLQQQSLLLSETLGASSEADILSQRLNVLSDFKDKYIAIQKEMADYANKTTTSATRNFSSISSSGTYEVKKGDTLSGIADYFGVTLAKLKSANGNITKVTAGQKVKLPQYRTGTLSADGGLSILDELGLGSELIIHAPTQGRLVNMEKGGVVYDAEKTKNLDSFGLNPQQFIANQLSAMQPNLSFITPNNRNNAKVEFSGNLIFPNITHPNQAQEFIDECARMGFAATTK